MGTNFYWKDPPAFAEQMGWDVLHIGKRSACGQFCWSCGVPLIEGDIAFLHYSGRVQRLDVCPKCGGKQESSENIVESAVGVELGLSQEFIQRPIGVHSCCSFSWAQEPDFVAGLCRGNEWEPVIEDEYGTLYTGREFVKMLLEMCPIQYTDGIGDHNWS